jgi:thymidylate kinase
LHRSESGHRVAGSGTRPGGGHVPRAAGGGLPPLRTAGVPFCVLRNRDRIPSGLITGSDVDLILPAGTSVAKLIALLADLKPVQIVPHHANLEIYLPVGERCLHVDLLIGDREWRGAPYLRNTEILAAAEDDGGIVVASRLHQAFCAWFSSLTRMRIFKPRYVTLIESTAKHSRAELSQLLQATFGDPLGARLLKLADDGQLQESNSLAGKCRRAIWLRSFRQRPLATLGGVARHYASELKLWIKPRGLCVAILGPDGAGKSAVCSGITDATKAELPFSKIEVEHLYQRALPRLSELRKGRLRRKPAQPSVTHDPHGKKPHTFVVAIFCLLYSVMDQWLSRVWWGRFKLSQNRLLLHDRHMMEIMVDPKRFRYGGPGWFARLVSRFSPSPDLVILLDAPADVLQSRKKEVPFEETQRQRECYRDMVSAHPRHRIIDASLSKEHVVQDVKRAIADELAARTMARDLARLEGRDRKKATARQWLRRGSWGIVDQMLISFTNFATMVLLARGLGPAAFGAFSLVYGGLLFANSLQGALVTQPHGVLSAGRRGRAYADYTASTLWSQMFLVVLGAAVSLAGAAASWLGGWGITHLLLALTPSIVAWQLQEFIRRVLYHEARFSAAFWNDVISYGGQTVVIAVLWWMQALTGPSALYALMFTSLAASLLGFWQLRTSLAGRFRWEVLMENGQLGKWLAGAEMGYWLNSQIYMLPGRHPARHGGRRESLKRGRTCCSGRCASSDSS